MKLNINESNQQLEITLDCWEKLWAFYWDESLKIPLKNIQKVSTRPPEFNWFEIRAPGTFLPFVIKAGTYYTFGGKEFWYVTEDGNYLVLELQDSDFSKIILNTENNQDLYYQIHSKIVNR